MRILDADIGALGMGCWPIGGPMFGPHGTLGYANAEDAESVRTIHAAIDGGIRLFDTAAVYGAGHAERLLGYALQGRADVIVVSKIGIAIDELTKRLLHDETDPRSVMPAIDRCLERLGRDRIDILLLHLNDLPVREAEPIFEQMERAMESGKIRAYGWSTDLSRSAAAVAQRHGFVAVEHAMNILLEARAMQQTVRELGLHALIRSPLGMGLLTGKYGMQSTMAPDDIRATASTVTPYFRDGRPNAHFLRQFDAVRDLLQTGGRSLAQGAICWLWGKSDRNIPIPGARTVGQMEDIAGALAFGPLPLAVMEAIDARLDRADEDERPR